MVCDIRFLFFSLSEANIKGGNFNGANIRKLLIDTAFEKKTWNGINYAA